ncbi:Uncharacterised protein [Legionella feeleii]|uniref:Uncharacterized protein n=1 Tax=Legionella feeleii TaxID=453 RepID=A0A378IUA5_9GAMM|nr:Uncharacterised protein [Legionella feeleii]
MSILTDELSLIPQFEKISNLPNHTIESKAIDGLLDYEFNPN